MSTKSQRREWTRGKVARRQMDAMLPFHCTRYELIDGRLTLVEEFDMEGRK